MKAVGRILFSLLTKLKFVGNCRPAYHNKSKKCDEKPQSE